MSDSIDMAQEGLERAHHHARHGHAAGHDPGAPTPDARQNLIAAVMIAILAALAVLVEMGANDAQTAYLAHYVAASDVWSEYQAKSVRHAVYAEAGDILAAAAADPKAAAARAAAAQGEAARMQSGAGGMTELAGRAKAEETARDRAGERHEHLERGVRALQIAIVMLGLFLTTRLRPLLYLGAALGAAGLLYSAVCALGVP